MRVLRSLHRRFAYLNKNHLRTLELDPNRSYELPDLKKAYFDLTKKYHPDVYKGGAAKFMSVKNAFEQLERELQEGPTSSQTETNKSYTRSTARDYGNRNDFWRAQAWEYDFAKDRANQQTKETEEVANRKASSIYDNSARLLTLGIIVVSIFMSSLVKEKPINPAQLAILKHESNKRNRIPLIDESAYERMNAHSLLELEMTGQGRLPDDVFIRVVEQVHGKAATKLASPSLH